VSSCIFNIVDAARRIYITVVGVETDVVGVFVIETIPLLQTAEVGNARQ
jgi:hypothetical protein